jgi:hypothetical protein
MTTQDDKPTLKTRLLAMACSCCPFCIARRVWPDSAYGRFMAEAEKNCPACKAYALVHADQSAPR